MKRLILCILSLHFLLSAVELSISSTEHTHQLYYSVGRVTVKTSPGTYTEPIYLRSTLGAFQDSILTPPYSSYYDSVTTLEIPSEAYKNGSFPVYYEARSESDSLLDYGVVIVKGDKLVDTTITLFDSTDAAPFNGYVNDIKRDSSGLLWFGTSRGLVTYDGNTFKTILQDETGHSTDYVRSLEIGPDGTVWIGTTQGLLSYKNNSWTSYDSFDCPPFKSWVDAITIDSSGQVWAGTFQEYLAIFDGNSWREVRDSDSTYEGSSILAMKTGSDGTVWVSTLAGFYAVRDGQWTSQDNSRITFNDYDITSLTFDKDDNIYAGSFDGLLWNNGEGWEEYGHFFYNDGIFRGIAVDSSNTIWTCSQKKGLFRGLTETRWEYYTKTNGALPYNECLALYIDTDDAKWVGFTDGYGVAKLQTPLRTSIPIELAPAYDTLAGQRTVEVTFSVEGLTLTDSGSIVKSHGYDWYTAPLTSQITDTTFTFTISEDELAYGDNTVAAAVIENGKVVANGEVIIFVEEPEALYKELTLEQPLITYSVNKGTIRVHQMPLQSSFTLYSPQGRIIKRIESISSGTITIDNLIPGVYLSKVQAGDQTFTKSIRVK